MTHLRRTTLISGALLAGALALLSGCNETKEAQASNDASSSHVTSSPKHTVPAGTSIAVALGSTISSETANAGDSWHGTVTQTVSMENGGTIPAGSAVQGIVKTAVPAKRGSRAMLDLSVRSINVNGRDQSIAASSEAVIAGSPRARNLGAIAGGVAAGALIGKAVGDHKNATVGGLIGGAAATGVVATSKGYQVVLKDGTVMSFTVSETVAMR